MSSSDGSAARVTYSDEEIDGAIAVLTADIARRAALPDGAPSLATLAGDLHALQAHRQSGDAGRIAAAARSLGETLLAYRPTNATSRSKAILAEVAAQIGAA
ncbi:MAG: hypothetical protein NVSMB64_15310 [Candidatus Velthaea sp.]